MRSSARLSSKRSARDALLSFSRERSRKRYSEIDRQTGLTLCTPPHSPSPPTSPIQVRAMSSSSDDDPEFTLSTPTDPTEYKSYKKKAAEMDSANKAEKQQPLKHISQASKPKKISTTSKPKSVSKISPSKSLKQKWRTQFIIPKFAQRDGTVVHVVDGTYELFRCFYAVPDIPTIDGRHVAAAIALARTLMLLTRKEGATHVGVAFDSVIQSFRNDLFDGYKTGDGIPESLHSQFGLAEQMCRGLGFVTWSMDRFEADDALATAARRLSQDERVAQVRICTPDKDLTQVVDGNRIVCINRRSKTLTNEKGVLAKYGVGPSSIPDWLGLVGDTADGIPGIKKWGAKTASTLLGQYQHIEDIPLDSDQWECNVRSSAAVAAALKESYDNALLYRKLATLRYDVELEKCTVDELEWKGASRKAIDELVDEVDDRAWLTSIHKWCD